MKELIRQILSEMTISSTERQKYYKHFDSKGIEFSNMTVFGKIDSTNFKFQEVYEPFIKINTPFNLPEEVTNELVLDYIYDTTGVRIGNINDLPKYKSLNGKPFLIELQSDNNNLYKRFILPWQEVTGDVFFRGDKGVDYTELPKTKTVNGNLSIYDSQVKNLGGIETINGDFIFSVSKDLQLKGKTQLKSLTPLKYVGGNLIIRGNSINTLGSLESVKGNVSLRFSQVRDLGKLKFIGGNLLISKYNKDFINFNGVTIMGKIKIYNDSEISPFI